MKKWTWGLAVLALLLTVTLPAIAQESAVKGNLSGVILDSTGAVVPGAKVTLTGPMGTNAMTTDQQGEFTFPLLSPGSYAISVEKQGFRTAQLKAISVNTNKTTSVKITMQPGAVNESVEVSAAAVTIDTTTTAVGADLTDQFYQAVPVPRNVAGLMYTAPGVVSGGGTGAANPSIGGASGLENLYVADGVNITDSAFGGLGVFSRSHGASVASGINLSFIKEVNVKTAGFEPQYGQSDGGIVQIVTKSGSNKFHGAIAGYFAPESIAATPLQADDVRTFKNGYQYMPSNYDVSGELGGYVPGLKNHLFFFGSVDPTWNKQHWQFAKTSPLYANGVYPDNRFNFNYAAKLTFRINDRHQIESSVFGDPGHRETTFNSLTAINNTGFSSWDYGTRNWVTRYNGTLSNTWLVNGSVTWTYSKFIENPLQNNYGVSTNISGISPTRLQGFGFLENHETNNHAINFDTQKIAHFAGEHTFSVGYHYERPSYDNIRFYSSPAASSPNGSDYGFVVPSTNMAGQDLGSIYGNFNCNASDPTCPIGKTTNAFYLLQQAPSSCTQCPLMNFGGSVGTIPVRLYQYRGIFSPDVTPTTGRYHAAYINDSWAITDRITASLGLRWEQWRMTGGSGSSYTLTDNWAPRIGISVDPWGDRKTKFYANFGRYNYQTPLDAAIRNLSAESDLQKLYFAPGSTNGMVDVNPDGSINVIPDAAHLLNGTAPGLINASPVVSISSPSGYVFAPGTKMMYNDEWTVGAEHEFKGGYVVSARFIYRRLGRIMEDMAGLSPEAFDFTPLAACPTGDTACQAGQPSFNQNYLIGNPNRNLDIFQNENPHLFAPTFDSTGAITNFPTGCTNYNTMFPIVDVNGNTWSPGNAVCFTPNANGSWGGELGPNNAPFPDGRADGFPNPVRNYKAVEIEVNKAFQNNWMMRVNWRIASLVGNYEGAYRNDNNQTDPNISSLYDFTAGVVGMLGDQFAIGPLNTDRRHVVNGFLSYTLPNTFLKGLTLGTGIRVQSGTPISELWAHPGYGNAGEVPVGGRGKLGRTPVIGTVDAHMDMPIRITEGSRLHLMGDFFNIANTRQPILLDQNYQLGGGIPNPDFQLPVNFQYQQPFYARFGVKWEF
jgi:hypothetical protein